MQIHIQDGSLYANSMYRVRQHLQKQANSQRGAVWLMLCLNLRQFATHLEDTTKYTYLRRFATH